jgi:hypothetical protein
MAKKKLTTKRKKTAAPFPLGMTGLPHGWHRLRTNLKGVKVWVNTRTWCCVTEKIDGFRTLECVAANLPIKVPEWLFTTPEAIHFTDAICWEFMDRILSQKR